MESPQGGGCGAPEKRVLPERVHLGNVGPSNPLGGPFEPKSPPRPNLPRLKQSLKAQASQPLDPNPYAVPYPSPKPNHPVQRTAGVKQEPENQFNRRAAKLVSRSRLPTKKIGPKFGCFSRVDSVDLWTVVRIRRGPYPDEIRSRVLTAPSACNPRLFTKGAILNQGPVFIYRTLGRPPAAGGPGFESEIFAESGRKPVAEPRPTVGEMCRFRSPAGDRRSRDPERRYRRKRQTTSVKMAARRQELWGAFVARPGELSNFVGVSLATDWGPDCRN